MPRKYDDTAEDRARKAHAAYMREWRRRGDNAQRDAERVERWVRANPEKRRAIQRAYYQRHREQIRRKAAERVDRDPEKDRASKRAYVARNPHKVMAVTRKRQAAKLNATPVWANQFAIQEAYDLAKLRERCTGIPWDVDHIVPLQSKLVCGLHVESNIQVIPRCENRSKSNRVWPDMPGKLHLRA